MKDPLVSVLVPVYNVEDYLERCLDSITGQTLYNIEIICVNDGSTDSSLEILERCRKKDDRIRIIDKPNGGLPSARNAGLDAAKGKYVGFVDSDDYIEINMFRKMYETAQMNKSDVVVCGAHIFPEKPKASGWLYSRLSTWQGHYDKFEPWILFDCACTTPFLWRTLIKRSLIEEYGLRLDEKILVGEDQAFQAKVYPKAKGITIIPDKLYHYCWYRKDSMMNQDVYQLSSLPQKMKSHSVLVNSIARQLMDGGAEDDMKTAFLKWGIPFVYADFIALPLSAKAELAGEVTKIWKDSGYYNLKWGLASWIQEQYEYFCRFATAQPRMVYVSIIVPVSDRTEYLEKALDSILSQDVELECILVNNGTSDETYRILHKYLFLDKRIRLYNMEKKSYADALNNGLRLAVGKYVVFCETDGWYKDSFSLRNWAEKAEYGCADICASVPAMEPSDIFLSNTVLRYDAENADDRMYIDNDFHHVLYRREFLAEKKIQFQDNSIITGIPFLITAVAESARKTYAPDRVYIRRHMHRPDWISTEKCEKVLEALEGLMVYSLEKQNAHIQAKVLSILNDDYYKKMIVNNTRAYCMPPESRPGGENSQVEIFAHIYSILGMARPEWLGGAGYDLDKSYAGLLYELIQERHKFLAGISDRYCAL